MLQTTECLPINNFGKEYTDCMEFSLYRFFQILFFSPEEIRANGNSKYNFRLRLPKLHNSLQAFIRKYPIIYQLSSHYRSNIQERQDWAIFLSNRKCFNYYRNDGAELMTNLSTIFSFLQYFLNVPLQSIPIDYSTLLIPSEDLPEFSLTLIEQAYSKEDTKPEKGENEEKETPLMAMKEVIQNNFQLISEIFSISEKQLKIEISSHEVDVRKWSWNVICSNLTRPDREYRRLRGIYDYSDMMHVIYSDMTIDILINEQVAYQWYLTEVYLLREDIVKNRFITGHSVIHQT